MEFILADDAKKLREFYDVPSRIYEDNRCYRSTEDDLVKLLVSRKSAFCEHARIVLFLIVEEKVVLGRFALIRDEKMPDYVQVSFFQADPNLCSLLVRLKAKAKELFPECKRILIGFDGHLNYSVGFLSSRFDQPAVFGLPYTPEYYCRYFSASTKHTMLSYRFSNKPFFLARKMGLLNRKGLDIRIRTLDKKNFKRDVQIYTELNNECFVQHPFWSERTYEEDAELFDLFKPLLNDENLLIAEHDGKPIAFLLWYPDFNQLGNKLGIKEYLKFKLGHGIDTVRLAEIGVLPAYRRKGVMRQLVVEFMKIIEEKGYKHTEAGFIFEKNKLSMSFTKRVVTTLSEVLARPYREYCVFEDNL